MSAPPRTARPARTARTARAVVAALVVVGPGLAACTGGAGPAGPTSAATPASAADAASGDAATMPAAALDGVAVEIRQSRADWGDRVVQLRVANGTPAPFVVVSATLRASSVTGASRSDPARSRAVPAGSSRDFSVALGDPVCPAGTPTDAAVDLVLADDAGRRAELAAVPADPQGHLDRIRGEDCAAAAVAAGAALAIGPEVTVQDRAGVLTATLRLVVRPVDGGPRVSVTAVERSNLLTPPSGLVWTDPALVDPPPGGATVDLELTQARCDPHAVAEDKRGTFFGVHATVDGVPQAVFYLAVDDGVRAQVYDYIGRACGWDGAGT